MKKPAAGFHAAQGGQAIILVLILLVLGSLVLVPALSLSMTALKANKTYVAQTNALYTADSGIEDGVWRIKYDFFGPNYDAFDYTTVYNYETEELNGLTADVTLQNVWVPTNVTLSGLGLTAAGARDIIESERLVVTGSAGAIPGQPYDIKIDYDPVDRSENLTVKSIGVWLPQGFTYTGDTDASTLDDLDPFDPAYAEGFESEAPGGTAIVWSYEFPYPLFTDFPGVSTEDSPMSLELSFTYEPPEDSPSSMPTAIAWVTTELDDGSPSDYPVSWDVDTRIFKITSTADDTYIQAYSSKAELRQMGDAMTGEYVAIGNSLMLDNYYPYDRRDTLITESTTSITSVPADGDALEAYLYWTGWLDDSHLITVLDDTGSDITTNWNRATPSDWSQGSGEYVGENTGGSANADYLTLDTLDLSSYEPGTVLITWDQSSGSGSVFMDTADNLTNWTNGSAWSASGGDFVGNNNPGGAAAYLTMKSTIDLSAASFGDIQVTWDQGESGSLESTDYLYYAFSSNNGTSWSSNYEAFHDDNPSSSKTVTVPSDYLTSLFKMRFQLSGWDSSEYCYVDNVRVEWKLDSGDGLDFAVSGDNGSTWSDSTEAFRDDVTGSNDSYEYYLPAVYTTGQFMFRFDTVGLAHGQSVSVDNILIRDLPPDTEVTFEIDGQQVHFDGNGDPHAGSDPVEADSSAVLLAPASLGGYFYRSKTDVSKLVKTYPINQGEEHHTGNAAYTVGDVDGSTGNYLSHCGWSMILIYASPTTAGHYLYLRDFFADNPGSTNLDFDKDGVAGGDITNFVVPEPIRNKQGDIIESVAARITCFVGEGDSNYTGDSLEITGQQSGSSLYLSNSASPYNNVWNGASPGMSYAGIDVDTFEVDWDQGILQPGDTTLHLDMDSGTDAWTFIYLIMSVRSETLTSGTTHYLVNRN